MFFVQMLGIIFWQKREKERRSEREREKKEREREVIYNMIHFRLN